MYHHLPSGDLLTPNLVAAQKRISNDRTIYKEIYGHSWEDLVSEVNEMEELVNEAAKGCRELALGGAGKIFLGILNIVSGGVAAPATGLLGNVLAVHGQEKEGAVKGASKAIKVESEGNAFAKEHKSKGLKGLKGLKEEYEERGGAGEAGKLLATKISMGAKPESGIKSSMESAQSVKEETAKQLFEKAGLIELVPFVGGIAQVAFGISQIKNSIKGYLKMKKERIKALIKFKKKVNEKLKELKKVRTNISTGLREQHGRKAKHLIASSESAGVLHELNFVIMKLENYKKEIKAAEIKDKAK